MPGWSSDSVRKPLVPEWLAMRQLNDCLAGKGVLMNGLCAEDLTDILDEENSYDGPYSPELLAMLDGVDFCFIDSMRHSPIFYREVFEPWYFEEFAPRIFDSKLPTKPPPIAGRQSGGGGGGLFLVLIVIAILAACWYVFTMLVDISDMWKMLRSLDEIESEKAKAAETASSQGN